MLRGWEPFEKAKPFDKFVSWEAFVEYVAANPGDKTHDHHWRSQFNQCRICNVDYHYITHIEHSEDETAYIFDKERISHLAYIDSKERLAGFFCGNCKHKSAITGTWIEGFQELAAVR